MRVSLTRDEVKEAIVAWLSERVLGEVTEFVNEHYILRVDVEIQDPMPGSPGLDTTEG